MILTSAQEKTVNFLKPQCKQAHGPQPAGQRKCFKTLRARRVSGPIRGSEAISMKKYYYGPES
jgi:hypothetical protein